MINSVLSIVMHLFFTQPDQSNYLSHLYFSIFIWIYSFIVMINLMFFFNNDPYYFCHLIICSFKNFSMQKITNRFFDCCLFACVHRFHLIIIDLVLYFRLKGSYLTDLFFTVNFLWGFLFWLRIGPIIDDQKFDDLAKNNLFVGIFQTFMD